MSAKNVQFKISIVKYLKLYVFSLLADQLLDLLDYYISDHFFTCYQKKTKLLCVTCLPLFSQVLSILLVFDIFSYAGLTQTLFEHSSKKNKTRKITINLCFIKRYFTTTIWTRRELQFIWSESIYCSLVAKRCQCIMFLMHLKPRVVSRIYKSIL